MSRRGFPVQLLLGMVLFATPDATATPRMDGFVEITDSVGLAFVHDPEALGAFRLREVMGSGGALLDYDDDGDLDIYLIQSSSREPNRLYRQELDGTFTDVTEASGLGDRGYGMGVAVGDLDNDGRVDVFVTNAGPNRLYRNLGGGRFRDVSASAGISGDSWSASATFCDIDGDGYLDLYVTNYLEEAQRSCRGLDGNIDYCSPEVFPGVGDSLYRNRGNGTFTDVSAESGLRSMAAPGLGVLCADWNDDGRMDFYVANDGSANQLWIQKPDGRFTDQALFDGVAFNGFGKPEAGMGVAAGDIDLDGNLDIIVTHLAEETHTLYRNDGGKGFEDVTPGAGLALVSLSRTGFGTGFADVDHDGNLDLLVANGRVTRAAHSTSSTPPSYWDAYAEPNSFFRNLGRGAFREETEMTGSFGAHREVSRSLIFGDVDDDGDMDLLVTQTGGPARLFRNDLPKVGTWLEVTAIDPRLSREAYGAIITLVAGGQTFRRLYQPGYGYLSSSDPRAHFGLPPGAVVEEILVSWPDGELERFPGGTGGRWIRLYRGRGERKRE